MSANSVAPGAQQKRFAAYLDSLAQAAGHEDRIAPLKSYCTGLLLPGEHKSVEPMAVRIRPAHRDYWGRQPRPEEWLLIEWPKQEKEPIQYWLSALPEDTKLRDLVRLAKHRWIIERDYEERKQELGLGHYEGRGWRGFHHHATLCTAAYGLLVAERSRFSPSARAGQWELPKGKLPPEFRPRGSARARRTA
jgi:SRSO17 transposase